MICDHILWLSGSESRLTESRVRETELTGGGETDDSPGMHVGSATVGCLVGALALGVGACGGDDDGGGGAAGGGGKTLTIYSSMPLQGASSPQTKAIVNGMKLALEQAGSKAGEHPIKYVSLDNSTAQAGTWTPEATSANARKAAQDDTTAVYLGEFNSGAAAVSIPILNEAGVPQISPANTAVGLTMDEPGATPGEPDKYYPTGQRTYTRIVARDSIKGPAMVTVMKEDGCTKVQLTNDKEVYGAGLAQAIEAAAGESGLDIISNEAIDKNAPNYRSLAQSAAAAGADCFAFSGITGNNAVQLYKDFAAALPDAKLYGPDGVCESGFVDPSEGRHPGRRGAALQVHVPDAADVRAPAGGPGVLHGLRREVRRQVARSVRDLRLRGDAPGARRDRALGDGREGGRPQGAVRHQGPRRACSAPTRSTTTATRR